MCTQAVLEGIQASRSLVGLHSTPAFDLDSLECPLTEPLN